MPTVADYRIIRDGDWRFVVLPEYWNDSLRTKVLALVSGQAPAKHPQTLQIDWPDGGEMGKYYLKVFHRTPGIGAVKDFCRSSKAFRFWRQGVALASAGFKVPLTIAAGEHRYWGFLKRAFVLTAAVSGRPLPIVLADLAQSSDRRGCFNAKRDGVAQLAQIIREFHRQGFVHGDMIASNLLVADGAGNGPSFFMMDNDRTRRYPAWFRPALWKRNLIQLNRMPLPGITLQDRMRFLRVYLGRQKLTDKDRIFSRWLEAKTRQRRKECDGADPTVDFRQLMRWNGTSSA